MVDQLRPVCAPEVPETTRRRLLGSGADASMALLAAVLTALFGTGAVAVLAGGVRPDGARRAFDELAGGGGLLVAAAAGLLVVHGLFCAVRRWRAQRSGRYLGRHALAHLAARDPQAATLLGLAQHDVRRIRLDAGPGDEVALRRTEWAIARTAVGCAADPGRHAELAEQVDQLARWADRHERSLDRLDPPRRAEPAPGRGQQRGPLRRVRAR